MGAQLENKGIGYSSGRIAMGRLYNVPHIIADCSTSKRTENLHHVLMKVGFANAPHGDMAN